jgi:hypothetical protein
MRGCFPSNGVFDAASEAINRGYRGGIPGKVGSVCESGDAKGQGVDNVWYVIDPANFPPKM